MVLFALIAVSSAQTQVLPAERPPALQAPAECERWEGEATGGNDATVLFEFVLCGEDAVTGEVQWSSLVSGWNRRTVVGEWDATHTRLQLRDTAVVAERPEPGWYFCEIDRYDLQVTDSGTLHGGYESAACNDRARFELTHTGQVATPHNAPPPPRSAPSAVPTVTSCGPCSVSGTVPSLMVLMLSVMGVRRRGRRLGRGGGAPVELTTVRLADATPSRCLVRSEVGGLLQDLSTPGAWATARIPGRERLN